MGILLRYEKTGQIAVKTPSTWPKDSILGRDVKLPSLVIAIHPHCPCSRATLGELAKLMARSQGKLKAFALFYQSVRFGNDWEKSDLWKSATRIPGVELVTDPEGNEAARFHLETSGETLLYDALGQLQFAGGITSGRGHAGDNAGRASLQDFIRTGTIDRPRTTVFGCALRGGSSTNAGLAKCCQESTLN
jgi:hypothetical protein